MRIHLSLLALFAFVLFPVLALAQLADPGADPSSFLLEIVKAVQGGDWRGLAVLVAIGVTWAVKKWGAQLWPWLATRRGGTALALFLGVVGTLVPAFAGGAHFSLKLAIDALLFGFTSMGGWLGLRNLVYGEPKVAVDAEAGKTVKPLPADATLQQLGAEADKPVG
jgi:hypothetical protein